MDAILEPTKSAVLDTKKMLDEAGITEQRAALCGAAGRYVRRPPIAQYRITALDARNVTFWYKDKKLHCRVNVKCALEQFVERWGQHILERYEHAVHGFGLFGPRAVGKISAAVLVNSETRTEATP